MLPFTRAFGELLGVDRSALSLICEHLFVMFADALLLLFELADQEDERFQAAAARWHANGSCSRRICLCVRLRE